MADRLTDQQISLPVLNNPRRESGAEVSMKLPACCVKPTALQLYAQRLVAFTGDIQEWSDLVRLLIQRRTKDFLDRL